MDLCSQDRRYTDLHKRHLSTFFHHVKKVVNMVLTQSINEKRQWIVSKFSKDLCNIHDSRFSAEKRFHSDCQMSAAFQVQYLHFESWFFNISGAF